MESDGPKDVVKVEAGFESEVGKEVADASADIGDMEVDGPCMEGGREHVETEAAPQVDEWTVVTDEMCLLDDFQIGDDCQTGDVSNVPFDAGDVVDVEELDFDFKDLYVSELRDICVDADRRGEDDIVNGNAAIAPVVNVAAIVEDSAIVEAESSVAISQPDNAVYRDVMSSIEMNAPGFRQVADVDLVRASRGEDKAKSANNDRWALRRVDTLRHAMGWDMRVAFGDFPFEEIDILLSNLFAHVVKVKGGGTYPAASLMNLLGGYNRIIRRASIARTLKGANSNVVDSSFQIKNHPAFTRTRLTLKAALQKGQKEGANKNAVKKVTIISVAMEEALFADVKHQLTYNRGCQKLLAIMLLLRVGIRGGDELWQLDRDCITIEIDSNGKEYVKFEERGSKNNCVTADRYQPEQFRKAYHSYEERFIMCVKQYKRHLPPLAEGTKPDLFLGCINNPVGNIWFIKTAKVGKETSHKWLKNALELVGISGDLIKNKSGRATLITRLAASGVPDDVGRLISGHHTLSGYSRYDRTQALKMEAAQLCTFNPGMDYDSALTKVSEQFKNEQLVGTSVNLKPLVDRSERAQQLQLALRSELQITQVDNNQQVMLPGSNVRIENEKGKAVKADNSSESSCSGVVRLNDSAKALAQWHKAYDGIDWEAEMAKDPVLARALGVRSNTTMNNLGGNSFSNLTNCVIQICVGERPDPSNGDNKENMVVGTKTGV